MLAVVFVAAGCGSARRHPTTRAAVSRPQYTLQQVKAAFAAQGISLQKTVGTRRLVVLKDSQWNGPFGYQNGGGYYKQFPVPEFLVFVRDGPHSTRRGNLWVGYGDGEGATVTTALRQLARESRH